MIGDHLELKPHYLYPAQEILTRVLPKLITSNEKYFISISGESGSGKSTLAIALKHCLESKGIKALVLHMDDYFFLPPQSNHKKREADISWVGKGEVNLDLLQQNIDSLRSGIISLEKPLVDYKLDKISNETIETSPYRVFIIEGTYVSNLSHMHLKIFMDRDYNETLPQRISRARDPITPFVEQVLEIEHREIAPQKSMADVIMNKDYSVSFSTK